VSDSIKTTDPFTEAAYDKAIAECGGGKADYLDTVTIFLMGANWARDHLASQAPTDAEVLAALNADYALRFGPRNLPADSLEPYGDEAVRIMRAALSAARAARRRGER